MSITFWSGHPSDEGVNLSNSNALAALNRLGLDVEYGGEHDAIDFQARAMLANIGKDDAGLRAEITMGDGGCTWIEGGQRPGYWENVMDRLAAMADVAIRTTGKVCWG
jgi:hypothetical protein